VWVLVTLVLIVLAAVAEHGDTGGDFWRWLTDAGYRNATHKVHPLFMLWRCLWAPAAFGTLLALCVVMLVMYGPSMARRRWEDGI
jgi:hypothetical protein